MLVEKSNGDSYSEWKYLKNIDHTERSYRHGKDKNSNESGDNQAGRKDFWADSLPDSGYGYRCAYRDKDLT
jgi:hypothetical protein